METEDLLSEQQTTLKMQKAVRLVDYLLRLGSLRTRLIRDVDEYVKVLWLANVPHERGCFTQAWGRDEEHEPDEWLEVQNRREPELPTVPILCEDWVDLAALRNKNDLPELLSLVTRQIPNPDWHEESDQPENIPYSDRIEDHPEVREAWDRYVEERWLPWSEEHNVWEKVYKVYSSLFSIYQEQLRLGEEYELVLCLGLLTWQTPTGQRVRRHLVVADAILDFEARLGRFTVRSHTEGAKLRPELDMLDIEEQPARAEEIAKTSLASTEDDPWEKGCVEGVLQALVHSINANGEYYDSLEIKSVRASAKPIVEYAPALILRKRSTKGLTETLKRIREQIALGEDVPGEFADLAEIGEKNCHESLNEPEEIRTAFEGEVFFPKPSNDEQRRIVDKIQAASGVLVQGPPGTGKSHTIANLICHLLATGQRTLITAKTPRALQVLEGLVPEELRPLCINLLGSGLDERRSLESSVGGILRKNEAWNEGRANYERRELEECLNNLRKEKAMVSRRLRDISESETHSHTIAEGSYRGTAARIAEAVNRERPKCEWFTDSVPLDMMCEISKSDLQDILLALRLYTSEKRRELGLTWPETLHPPEYFDNLVLKETKATEQELISSIGADDRLASYLSISEVPHIENLRSSLQSFQHEYKRLLSLQKPWVKEAVLQVSNGEASIWRDLATPHIAECDLRGVLVSLRRYASTKRQELKLVVPDSLPSKDEVVDLFDADKQIAEEEETCLREGADKRLSNQLLPKRLVCGSCRGALDFKRDDDATGSTEQILACPHCGKRNRVRLNSIHNSALAIHDLLSVYLTHLQKLLASDDSWLRDALHDVAGGTCAAWSERHRVTKQAIVSIGDIVSIADETTLEIPASISVKALLEDASKLKEHLERGRKLGWWLFRPKSVKSSIYIFKTVRINGRSCSNLDDLSTLIDVLRVRLDLDKAWEFWQGLSTRVQGPFTLQLAALKSLSNALENALSLEKLLNECREVVHEYPSISEPVWHDASEIGKLVASCRLALIHQRRLAAASDLERLEFSAISWARAPSSHPVTEQLLNAVRERDADKFAQCIQTVHAIKEERQNLEHVEERLRQISLYAPVLAKELELTHNEPIWDIRLLSIGDSVLKQILALPSHIENCKNALLDFPGMGEILWSNDSDIERHIASCTLALSRHLKDEVAQDIRKVDASVSSIAAMSDAHPVTAELLGAIRDRNIDGYRKAIFKIQELGEERQRLQQLDEYLSKLRRLIPQVTKSLEQNYNEPYWEERFQRIDDAWHWAQARFWIEDYIRKEDIPALSSRAKQIEDEINDIIAKLASLHAWSFCFSRLKEDHRRHMEAWQQSMRRLGKGTGKHAPRHRREAQGHLNECREAVPAWVMPLHRVWDTVYPAPNVFDVIIVDEASQCGVEALPLFYLGKKILIVGDDKQISPDAVGLPRDTVHRLMEEFLHDFKFKSSFDIESSLFDHGKLRYGTRQVVLKEHFRCMPEIIRFSNDLCYSDTPLIPLRQYGANRLPPIEHVFVDGGYREGSNNRIINRPEAECIVERIAEMCSDKRFNGKTMGVVVLQGDAQAALIENQLLERLGAEQLERRRLVCGNPYSFQGDERDIMFLSLVAASNERIGALTRAADERRFNVAASRARDMMILFHSVTCDDLSVSCLRRQLLDFFTTTKLQQIAGIERAELERRAAQDNRRILNPPSPLESWFEVDVALELLRRDFTVLAQHEVAGKRIDLVVEGGRARLAIECDGDNWHGADRYDADMQRQRLLERCGWEFFRVRESSFYANRDRALQQLWVMLEERGIRPGSFFEEDHSENEEGLEDVADEQFLAEIDDSPEEDDDPTYKDDLFENVGIDLATVGRRAEEVTTTEIQNAIIKALTKCPNRSCTAHSLVSRVLREVEVLTRGNPRKVFEHRVFRVLNTLEEQGVIEKYKAKNNRIRLVRKMA